MIETGDGMETNAPTQGLDEVHEAFVRFPSPLALATREAGLVQVNLAWSARFGDAILEPGWSDDMTQGAEGSCHIILRTPGTGAVAEARARAVRVSGHVVLVVDESPDEGLFEAMRERIFELERLASTDHLTGAWNRAHFERTIAAELERSRAGRQAVSLVLLDIDHFKRVNDTYGHATGDAVLRELVSVARARIRASDMLFRWGGEEFAVLVSSAGYRGAERVAEKLRKEVSERAFSGVGRVTVSAGVAEHDGDESLADWFRRLDAALYAAKEAGRDRVVVDRRGNSDAWARAGGKSALHLVWQEAYESGDETIDAEHRELFELANRVIDASLDHAAGQAGILAALDTLLAHVQRHFADEEAILARLHYGDLEPHRRAHEGLVRRAVWMREGAQAGEANLGALVEFLAQDVVARHLLTMDRAFFPLFEKGARPAP